MPVPVQPKSAILKPVNTMSVEQAIFQAVREFSADNQQEILDHATRLHAQRVQHKPFKSIKGLWADPPTSPSQPEKSMRTDVKCGRTFLAKTSKELIQCLRSSLPRTPSSGSSPRRTNVLAPEEAFAGHTYFPNVRIAA